MTTQLQVERERNPDPAATLSVLVGIAAFGLVYWRFYMRDEDAHYEPPEEDAGDTLPGTATSLVLSPDCATVSYGSDWGELVALPILKAQVQQGRGRVLYPPSMRATSMDAVAREILLPYGPECVPYIPWRDSFLEAEPYPAIDLNDDLKQALAKQHGWENHWEGALGQWAGLHPEVAAFVVNLQNSIRSASFANMGVDVNHVPSDTGQYSPGITADELEKLRSLGYDLGGNVTLDFQNHYNHVKNYQTDGQWGNAALNLPEDNVIDDSTRTALADAAWMDNRFGSWMGLVETAANA